MGPPERRMLFITPLRSGQEMRVLNTEHTPLLTPFPKKIYEIVLGFHPKSFGISSHWSQLCFSDPELQILHMVRD